MPISPENKHRYPKNWLEIRQEILERAGDRCENCGVPNYAWRIKSGEWTTYQVTADEWSRNEKVTFVVLTIAHLDHVPEHNNPSNLRAWCQKCHLGHDREHHQQSRYMNRKKAANNQGLAL